VFIPLASSRREQHVEEERERERERKRERRRDGNKEERPGGTTRWKGGETGERWE